MEQLTQPEDKGEAWGQLLPVGLTGDQTSLKLELWGRSVCLRATNKFDGLEVVSPTKSKDENRVYCELSRHHIGKDASTDHVYILTNETLTSKTEQIQVNGANILDCIEQDFERTGSTKKGLKLCSGDTLTFQTLHDTFTKQISFVFFHEKDRFQTDNKELETLLQNYYLLKQIGVGRDSFVNVAIHKHSGIKYAAKAIKDTSTQKSLEKICQTTGSRKDQPKKVTPPKNPTGELWKSLEHPNIVALNEVIESDNFVCYIMELMSGGDLLNYLNDNGPLSEQRASLIFYQILDALHYLHSKSIVHRDIKPQNILFCETGSNDNVKLSDFGLSCYLKDDLPKTVCGTSHYIAPEMIKNASSKGYNQMIDMWSTGVLLYTMLSGLPPFQVEEEVGDLEPSIHFPDDPWSSISDHAKDLIKKLLLTDPSKRLSAEQAKLHPFISMRKRRRDTKEGEEVCSYDTEDNDDKGDLEKKKKQREMDKVIAKIKETQERLSSSD